MGGRTYSSKGFSDGDVRPEHDGCSKFATECCCHLSLRRLFRAPENALALAGHGGKALNL